MEILDEIRSVIPANRRTSGSGEWINFCCPACGDKRYRGGISFTATGGFRYYCFNGGCEYNIRPTGWEPGNGFGGRPRRLFEDLGGNTRNIPLAELMRWSATKFGENGTAEKGEELEVVHTFPEMELPEGSQPLMDVYQQDRAANQVMQFAVSRMGSLVTERQLYWSSKHPFHLIIPYFHYRDKIVGYLGRSISHNSGRRRFIQRAPSDYMYNQHLLATYSARYLFVVESPMDAMLLGCLAARNDRLTEKQVNLLKVSGKDIVMVPDQKRGEWEGFIEHATDNNWYIAVPDWGGRHNPGPLRATDIGGSVQTKGLLFTIKCLMQSTTRNYTRARVELGHRSV